MTKSQLEGLVNALLPSGQQMTAAGNHRPSMQKIIDELYDHASRGAVIAVVTQSGSFSGGDELLVIRSGAAVRIPYTAISASRWRGGHDASGGTYPATGGSGTGGAVQAGDEWYVSVAGELDLPGLPDTPVQVGALFKGVGKYTRANGNKLEGNSMKATFDPAKNLDLYFRKKRNGSKVFTFLDGDGNPYDLTGKEFLFVSGFEVELTVLDNTITVDFSEDEEIKRDRYFWELINTTINKTWLCGTAFFTDGLSAETEDTTQITIIEEGEPINVTINEPREGVNHWRGDYTGTDSMPTTGGTLADGSPAAGDEWRLTNTLTIGGFSYASGTIIKAIINNPGQTKSNWAFLAVQL